MNKILCRSIVAALGVLYGLYPCSASGQSFWINPVEQGGFTLEWLKPTFDENEEYSFLTSVLFLSARVGVSDNLRLKADLPLSYAGFNTPFANRTETAIGNPYLGLEVGDASVWAETGIRLPLAPSATDEDNSSLEALLLGVVADYDRFEAFLPDAFSAVVLGNYQSSRSAFSLRLQGGSLVMVRTNEDGLLADGTEVFFSYGAQGWYEAGVGRVGAGLTGRVLATEADLSFGERSFHQAGFSVEGTFGTLQPGVYIRLPLDDELGEELDFVVGLHLTVLVP